ncbi:MAG: Rieske (2Fe-2S) protein [Planctomycetaceae bacterium]|nr:Rieske (2Fe-2S) protein [Planctomycetaceae bacterium]
MLAVTIDGRSVLLANVDGVIVAYENRCPHQGVPLSKGALEGGQLTCSAHRWCFDLRTGAGINPAVAKLKPVNVRKDARGIEIDANGNEGP